MNPLGLFSRCLAANVNTPSGSGLILWQNSVDNQFYARNAAGVDLPIGGSTGQSDTPTIVAGAGAGTTPTVSIVGNNGRGVITVVAGSSPGTTGVVVTVTLADSDSFPTGTIAVISPANSATAGLAVGAVCFATKVGLNSWAINSGGTALTGAATYAWNYSVGGY